MATGGAPPPGGGARSTLQDMGKEEPPSPASRWLRLATPCRRRGRVRGGGAGAGGGRSLVALLGEGRGEKVFLLLLLCCLELTFLLPLSPILHVYLIVYIWKESKTLVVFSKT
jgi:hypothetical protein